MKQERSKKVFLNDKNHKQQKKKLKYLLVLEGKVNAAIRLLDDDTRSGVLPLSANAIKTLKHPDTKPSNDTMMFHGPFNHINEIMFDGINADLVRKCAIRIKGLHGPSGLDANFWSKILCNSTFVNDQTISVTL